MASLSISGVGNVENAFPLRAARQQRSAGTRPAQNRSDKGRSRYGHRAAVVLSRSDGLRSSLERALVARGAAVVNFRTLPAFAHIEDLLTSGLILLAPPKHSPAPQSPDWIETSETDTAEPSVNTVIAELERRGVLPPREYMLGDGI